MDCEFINGEDGDEAIAIGRRVTLDQDEMALHQQKDDSCDQLPPTTENCLKDDQLRWVYETDTSDDSLLLASPVFKKRTHEKTNKSIDKKQKQKKETRVEKASNKRKAKSGLETEKATSKWCFCDNCSCKWKKEAPNASNDFSQNNDEEKEKLILEELKKGGA
jgi:hypothetical protein